MGRPLNRRATFHRGPVRRRACCGCYGSRLRAWACLGCLWGWSRARGEKRGKAGGPGHRACERSHWCARAAGARASWARGGRRRRGQRHGVLRTLRSIGRREGESRGGRRCLAGGGYSAGAHYSVLQSAQMAGMAFFWQSGHDQACLVALGRSKECVENLGCLGWTLE